MDEILLKGKVYYYSREKLYHSMLQACEEGVNKFKGNLSFNFYRAVALLLCNRFHESVPKLQTLQLEDDFRLASLLALVYIYEVGELKDASIFPHLYSQIEDCKLTANSEDLMESAYVSFLFENYQTAYEYVTKSIKLNPTYYNLVLKGWIELRLSEIDFKISYKPRDSFEMALEKEGGMDAIIGLSKCFCNTGKYEEALSLLNKGSSQYFDADFHLVQKLEVFFVSQNWEQFAEVYRRLQDTEKPHLESMNLHIVKLICVDSNYNEAASCIDEMMNYVEKLEPKNSAFLNDCAKLYSRICDRSIIILTRSFRLIEMAVQISPNKHEYLAELGYQCYLQGKLQDAIRYYKLAVKINESSVSALTEMTLCELNLNGKTNQLVSQIEFLLEIQETESTLLQYLASKIASSSAESKNLLRKALEGQVKKVENYSFSTRYLRVLDPDFLLVLVNEMLNTLQNTSEDEHKIAADPDILFLIEIIKGAVKACPGFFSATFLLAKLNYMAGKLTETQNILNRIINDLKNTSSNTYLLLAQTQIKQGCHESAMHNLEMGLSNDFTIRDSALYHFLMGNVSTKHEKYDEAIKHLKTALKLFNSKNKSLSDSMPTLLKRVTVYKELVQVYLKTNQFNKAADLLQEAVEEFKETPDESSVFLMSADFALMNGETRTAINMLEKIAPDDPCYVQAKIKLASIMLDKRRDKNAYLNCYKEVVHNSRSAEGYVLLGDAYLNILEPEEAIKAYEKALKVSPNDPNLTSRMGKALVLTHRYKKACEFYKSAIKSTDNKALKIELAELFIQINDMDTAEEFLTSEMSREESKNDDNIDALKYKTKLSNLLAEIQIQKNNIDGALETLKGAVANQAKIRRKLAFEQTDVPEEEINLAIELDLKIANLYLSQCEYNQAIMYQKDALTLKQNNKDVLTILAKTYVQINEMERCNEICNALLKLEPDNETALILLADIAFHKVDFETAMANFSNLVSKNPTNWKALERLIETLRRLGITEQASQYLEKSEQALEFPSKNTGFCYCSGLYHWYLGNPNVALKSFNNARQDTEWSKNALVNMIEICLSTGDEILADNLNMDDLEYKDSRTMALKTAERLLKELKQQTIREPEYKLKFRLLSNFHLLAYKERTQIEAALENFVTMASEDALKEHVGVVLGLASAYTLLKQSQRAKTQLKRLFKHNWTYEEAEYLERCWILHADYHMQSSKYDLASDLLKKVLKYNKSCVKAYENLGLISEKEQSYKEAANYYGNAWKLGGKSNPAVGYKLAFCFMKCKKYADAIETSQTVLSLDPNYPKIKKDVLDKSLNNLRT
ncbi:tetratricopeptide repeat protein 21B [Agrilus planipennis]|uniref:Tetratricopeptide repeat protein 21B n=1 Tax=Agrilus planipennis TaxID=224129 RepID=A0A1W4WRS1_AGRPL|nr:tetratricopeptide repeat protein 21B [Agrilus planipennis]